MAVSHAESILSSFDSWAGFKRRGHNSSLVRPSNAVVTKNALSSYSCGLPAEDSGENRSSFSPLVHDADFYIFQANGRPWLLESRWHRSVGAWQKLRTWNYVPSAIRAAARFLPAGSAWGSPDSASAKPLR